MSSPSDDLKIPLPKFLKILTENNVPVAKAMAAASKLYKEYNTRATLRTLSEVKLVGAGIGDKDDRKLVMTALRKAGYSAKASPLTGDTNKQLKKRARKDADHDNQAGSSTQMTAVQLLTTPHKRRRGVVEETNEFLPDGPADEIAIRGSLEFNEVLDQEILKMKSAIVNRAPLMTAWATVVAERMGFQREEALSIASAYTEMNAISKGVSIGVIKKGKEVGLDAAKGGSQPYVELMGRRPLYQTQDLRWRALSNGSPATPSTAFSYISRSFRQTTPHIMGALCLLANSFGPQEINDKGWSLYADFRPSVDGWGKRAEVRCETILHLMKPRPQKKVEVDTVCIDAIAGDICPPTANGAVKYEITDDHRGNEAPGGMSLEEYEATLDKDDTFHDLDPDVNIH